MYYLNIKQLLQMDISNRFINILITTLKKKKSRNNLKNWDELIKEVKDYYIINFKILRKKLVKTVEDGKTPYVHGLAELTLCNENKIHIQHNSNDILHRPRTCNTHIVAQNTSNRKS